MNIKDEEKKKERENLIITKIDEVSKSENNRTLVVNPCFCGKKYLMGKSLSSDLKAQIGKSNF